MMQKRSNLDEQQERKLLEIESRGFWLAFWGMIAVLLVQIVFVKDWIAIASTWVLLMALAIYLVMVSAKAGIWNRKLDMSNRTYLISSFISAIFMGTFTFGFGFYRDYDVMKTLIISAGTVAGTFVVCYVALRITAAAVKNRQNQLNAEPDDTMEE